MLKKYIIFGSVALLMAALFTLTGCSQATDSDGGTTVVGLSENHLYGRVYASDVDRAVESAKRTGRNVVLTDLLEIQGGIGKYSVADFSDLPVRVEGAVTVTGNVIVNGSGANLTFVEGFGKITVTSGGAFIYNGSGDGIYTDANDTGFKIKYVDNPLEGAQGTDARIAVPSYALGKDQVAAHVTHLYVLDKVTVDASSGTPASPNELGNPNVIALGEVDLTESNSAAFAGIGSSFIFAESAALTSSSTLPVAISGLPAGTWLPTIAALKQAITVNFDTSLNVDKIEGPEAVTLSTGTINGLVIENVAASGKASVNGTGALGNITIRQNDGDISIGGTGASGGTITIGDPAAPNVVPRVNAGTIAISSGTAPFDGFVVIHTNAKDGNIALSNGTGGVTAAVSVTGNAGTITIDAPTITGGVTVKSNSGNLVFAAPTIAPTSGQSIAIARNDSAGNITFTRNLILTGANILRVPVNYGNINFLGTFEASDKFGYYSADDERIAGTGKIIFGGDAEFKGDTYIETNTVFNGNVKTLDTASVDLKFDGDVTLDYERKITLAYTTTANTFTLGKGKRILVGGGVTPVVVAGTNVVITSGAAAGSVLVAGRALTEDDEEGVVIDKTLNFAGAAIGGITGNLRVLNGGVLSVAEGGPNILLGTTGGSLTLESGAILALPASQSFVFGNTTITGAGTIAGADTSQLIASNGAVTFSASKISGAGSTLTPSDLFAAPKITVGTANTSLDIEGVNIDVSAIGSLVINEAASPGVKITLLASPTNPGKITLNIDSLGNEITRSFAASDIGGYGKLSGAGTIHVEDVTGTPAVGDLIAGPASPLIITGPIGGGSTYATLDNTTTVFLTP
ncbi:MAG: hypothetical protein LBO65_03880 [Spirochaetaceae bacterium]|jgi:hypothetical protein|nr:hypothetical protein [Spirochaetaceae bacterium]